MKKKGFTLVELLVAMLCTTLVLGMVFSTVYYISRVNGELLDKSGDLYRLTALDEQVKGKTETEVRELIDTNYSDIIATYDLNTDTTPPTHIFTTHDGKTYTLVYSPPTS